MAKKKPETTKKDTAATPKPAAKPGAGAAVSKPKAAEPKKATATPAATSKAPAPAPPAPPEKKAPAVKAKAAEPVKPAAAEKAAKPSAAKAATPAASAAKAATPAASAAKAAAPAASAAKAAAPAASAAGQKKAAAKAEPKAEKASAASKPATAEKPARKVAPKRKAAEKPAEKAKKAPARARKTPAKTAKSKAAGAKALPLAPAASAASAAPVAPPPPAPPAPSAQSRRLEPPYTFERDLPSDYGDTKIVALVRDPEWIFLYWEIGQDTRARLNIPRGSHQRPMGLRVYDVTDVHFDGSNAHSFFDVPVNDMATSWYLRIPESARSYVVDLGVYSDDGEFLLIARSNAISVPAAGISHVTDEEWMNVTEEQFNELYRMSGGLRLLERQAAGSAALQRAPGEEILASLRSQWVGSGMWSGASGAAPRREGKRGFWLQVDCEVIIYGATEPDAQVTLQGRRIQLAPDGTFYARFAFPDGEIEMPVSATSSDGQETRQIKPVVKRTTH